MTPPTALTSPRTAPSSPEMLYDLLMGARTADQVTIYFRDGRIVTGALVFNSFKGTGRLIDVDKELSMDFAIDQIRDLRF
jgi:hypothetical protein